MFAFAPFCLLPETTEARSETQTGRELSYLSPELLRTFTEDEVRAMVEAAVGPLRARIAELEAEIARLKKTSATSSKPPSSDIVKPRAAIGAAKPHEVLRGAGIPLVPAAPR